LARLMASCTPSHFTGGIAKYESREATKERQRKFERMVQQRAFTEWVTLQPNGAISTEGRPLREELPKIIRMVCPIAFGRDAPKPWNRHKCIQGVVFFEGAVDDHVHIAVYSDFQVTPAELEDAFKEVFTKFFKKGTVWVDALDYENREAIIQYSCKELWKRDRYNDAEIFGPNYGADEFDVPRVSEAHLRLRERVWPRKSIRTPDFLILDPAALKLVLQDAAAEGRWFGPDPRWMSYEALEREARAVVVGEGKRAEKLARVRAMIDVIRRLRAAKYYSRAGAAQTPHSHRLTPDTCGRAMGRLGSFSLHCNWSCFPHQTLARGPPGSGSETHLPGG